jgi:hypothetical protein
MDEYDPFRPDLAREDVKREEFVNSNQQRDDVRALMSEAWGRRLMWSWLEFSGLRRTPMTGNSQTFFNCGMQNFGIMLESLVLMHCPDKWLLMQAEAAEAVEAAEARKRR